MGESEEPPEWDLSPLVRSTDPADVKKSLDEMLEKAKAVSRRYKGRIARAKPNEILSLLREIDSVYSYTTRPYAYSRLLFMSDVTNPVACELLEYVRIADAKIQSELVFADLELGETTRRRPELADEPVLFEFKHALEKLREEGRYQLSESEERIIREKNRLGIDSWSLLHTALQVSRRFHMKVGDEDREVGFMELQELMMDDADRSTRRRAFGILHEGLINDRLTWSYAFRSIAGDYVSMVKLRNVPDIFTLSLLLNDVSRAALDSLIEATRNNVDLIHGYLHTKARIMSLPVLESYDLYAPVLPSEKTMGWNLARSLIIDCFRSFDAEIGEYVCHLFEQRRVHAKPGNQEVRGGLCWDIPLLRDSWVRAPFTGTLLTTKRLAHEIGHAVHGYLASENNLWRNFQFGLCLSETASTFGELLFLKSLLSRSEDGVTKMSAICITLDDFRVKPFDMLARFTFERNAYATLEEGGNLDADSLDSMWLSALKEVYGNIVDWPTGVERWWAFLPHNFMSDFRFYNYPYAFGQLFSYALYGLYKKEGRAFVPKFKRILSAGGSASPEQLAAEIGFVLASREFWDIGFSQARAFLDELKKLVGTV